MNVKRIVIWAAVIILAIFAFRAMGGKRVAA
jgi:hypothetical protein